MRFTDQRLLVNGYEDHFTFCFDSFYKMFCSYCVFDEISVIKNVTFEIVIELKFTVMKCLSCTEF